MPRYMRPCQTNRFRLWERWWLSGQMDVSIGGLGGKSIPTHEATTRFRAGWMSGSRHDLRAQKSRTLPIREHVGSSKSPLLGRRETPSKTRRHEDTVLPCAGISPSSKSVTEKLGGFTCSFAEIRLEWAWKPGSAGCGMESTDNLSPCRVKVKPVIEEILCFLSQKLVNRRLSYSPVF